MKDKRTKIEPIFSTTNIEDQLSFRCNECGKKSYCSIRSKRYYLNQICMECKVSPDSQKYKSLYSRWFSIMARCYEPKNKMYPFYGAKGVTVCDEWKNDKQKFYQWAKLNGYNKDLDLDKDILSHKLKIDPPLYSPQTCMFVESKINTIPYKNISLGKNSKYKGVIGPSEKGWYTGYIRIDGESTSLGKSKYQIEIASRYDRIVINNNLPYKHNNISPSKIKQIKRYTDVKKRLRILEKDLQPLITERDRILKTMNNQIQELEEPTSKLRAEKKRIEFDLKKENK